MSRAVLACLVLVGCAERVSHVVSLPAEARTLDRESPYLKVHMKDGGLFILRDWNVDERAVSGLGSRYPPDRSVAERGRFDVPLDDVALFETNVVHTSPTVGALAVLTGISVGVTAYCLSDTKACFGSCPTFYLDGRLRAEGFSDSIAPSLEATDVDALGPGHGGRVVEIAMTNEALETHVVRSVALVAAPRPDGGRVFADADGALWAASAPASPTSCRAAEGDCRAALDSLDGRERSSPADATDLAARETLELEFGPADGDLGLVVAMRQTLLSTYVLYQGLAWLGRGAAEFLTRIADRGALRRWLGGVAVAVETEEGWVRAGEVYETGPLATDTHLLRLPRPARGPVRIRLELTRGHWRLDWVALARLGGRVEPVRVPATIAAGRPGGFTKVAQTAFPLVTLPGDAYTLRFALPADAAGYELFLESRGYYLEWMRREWLDEQNPLRAAELLLAPAAALRRLAPEYKAHEADLDRAFWSSRYAR